MKLHKVLKEFKDIKVSGTIKGMVSGRKYKYIVYVDKSQIWGLFCVETGMEKFFKTREFLETYCRTTLNIPE